MKVNFLIAGVQKGGTSSLDAYLRQHPQIGMAMKKEPHFFDNEELFSDDKPDYSLYHEYFKQHGKARVYGEATPIYTYWAPAARRISQYNPDMKLIVLLRDPTDRAWAHWRMNRSLGIDTASFSDAIRNEPHRLREVLPLQHRKYSYIDRGRYGVQIRRMLEIFERRQILFLKSEEFLRDPMRELEKVYEFLGLDAFKADTRSVYNVGLNYGSMPFADMAYLNETFQSDVEEVKSLLGWNCADWLSPFRPRIMHGSWWRWKPPRVKELIKKSLRAAGLEIHRVPRARMVTTHDFGANVATMPHREIWPNATYSPWLADSVFTETFRSISDHTLVDRLRCYELWSLAGRVSTIPGDVLEVGVWRGGTGCLIARKVQMVAPDRTVYLCDTFKGVVGAGEKDTKYVDDEYADTSQSFVHEMAGRLGLKNVHVLKGIFPAEFGSVIGYKKFAFVHIGIDVYQSSKVCFTWTWSRLSVGGSVVFDGYGLRKYEGVTRMVNELSLSDGIVVYNLNGHAVVVKTN